MPVDLSNPDYVVLTHNTASASIYYHGATLTSWVVEGEEMIFLSSKAVLDGSKAIRGGIPLAFPHFGTVEGSKLPQHGFARNSRWEFKGITFENAIETTATFVLTPENVPAALYEHWPKKFKLFYSVSLLESPFRLRTSLRVDNTGPDAWEFTALLHTYFRVPDILRTNVTGLQGLTYVDKVLDGARATEPRERVTVESEVDRNYLAVRNEVSIDVISEVSSLDGFGSSTLVNIRKSSTMPDIVVWNLWKEKAVAMADMGDDDYRKYICVEVGAVDKFIKLEANESWEGFQIVECPP